MGCPILRAQGTKQVQKGRLPSGHANVMDTGGTDGLNSCSLVSGLIKVASTGRITKRWD